MKFAFIAKHRHVWPVSWLCEALDVSRSGFHAWLRRGPSAHEAADEGLTAEIRLSFVGSTRAYHHTTSGGTGSPKVSPAGCTRSSA